MAKWFIEGYNSGLEEIAVSDESSVFGLVDSFSLFCSLLSTSRFEST